MMMTDEILRIEDSAMEHWRQGNPMKWIDISADSVVYVDPGLTAPVVGREAYTRYLEVIRGKIFYDKSEYVNPRTALYGNTAILTYNYHSLSKGDGQSLARTSFWNTTEVYRRFNDGWKIIHSHWSFIGHRAPERLELTIPVLPNSSPLNPGAAEVLALETGALELWRKGDPSGFIGLSHPDVSYFDMATPVRIDGLAAVSGRYHELAGKVHYEVMDFVRPEIQAFDDSAVLFYRFLSTFLNPNGTIRSRIPWNCTQVYVKSSGGWKIAHTHWSLINGCQNSRSGV
jgi:ketosteroid isomerase-like protein